MGYLYRIEELDMNWLVIANSLEDANNTVIKANNIGAKIELIKVLYPGQGLLYRTDGEFAMPIDRH